jgi:hypothetical protein
MSLCRSQEELNFTIEEMDLIDIYRTFHLRAANTHYFQHLMELSSK